MVKKEINYCDAHWGVSETTKKMDDAFTPSRPCHSTNIWKNSGELTELGCITDQVEVDEQLRVRLALKMMRKAYTNGSRFARER
jgi:hypothetical protein